MSDGNRPVAEFEELAMPLMNSVYNLARWLTRNDHDAEDLVQETYLKAYRSFYLFRSGTNFRAWTYRILRNTFLSSRTGLRAVSTISFDSPDEEHELPVENETPETLLLRDLDSRRIRGAIEDLPVHYREVLLLCDIEELSYREIAEILLIPIGTVMSRLARARRLIRQSLCGSPEIPALPRSLRARDTGNKSRVWTGQNSTGRSCNFQTGN